MSSFIIAANAVVPFMIYILFGMIIRRASLVDGPFLTKLNKLLFKAFFPLLMFRNITGIEGETNFSLKMVLFAVLGMLLLIGLLMIVIPRIEPEDSRRGVIIQAIFRGNYALFSIPLTTSLFGAEGTALSSLMMLVSIPMYNIMAVVVLAVFGGGKVSPGKILKDIATNPLIDGILAGLLFRLTGLHLPAAVSSPIAALAACTTPMALCVLGARMQLSSVRGNRKSILLVLSLKLVIVPALVTACAAALGFRGLPWFILFVYFGAPTAVSSVSMAENMGGDGELAGELVVASTLASIFSIFLWIVAASALGIM